jgi:hypothetical protein
MQIGLIEVTKKMRGIEELSIILSKSPALVPQSRDARALNIFKGSF